MLLSVDALDVIHIFPYIKLNLRSRKLRQRFLWFKFVVVNVQIRSLYIDISSPKCPNRGGGDWGGGVRGVLWVFAFGFRFPFSLSDPKPSYLNRLPILIHR